MQPAVDTVRRFNRFYTRRIGALRGGLLGTPWPLPEARLVYELGRRGEATATELRAELDLDAGYLSRLVDALRRKKLVRAQAAAQDARRKLLSLTHAGRKAFARLDSRSREEVAALLSSLAPAEQDRLMSALSAVEEILDERKERCGTKETAIRSEVMLRAHRPGDMGWVVSRHGAVYAAEYGWDERFEALVAGIVKDFIEQLDPARERCWIAERGGTPVGSVFVVAQSRSVAKLRLLLVEPSARGRGLGRRLVEECIAFARATGYRKLVLWTQSNLVAARAIYRKCGFALVRTEKHAQFGVPLDGEYWELDLGKAGARPAPRRRRGT